MSKVTIRVAIIAGQLWLGGAERQLFYLVNGLDRSRFEPVVLTLNPGAGAYWEERIRAAGISMVEIPRGNRLLRAWQIRRVIQHWQADVVQGFHFYVNGYGVLANWLRSKPSIGGVRFLPTRERIDRVPLGPWRRMCLYSVDRLVCNSHVAKETLHRAYPRLPEVHVIPNGVACLSDDEVSRLRQHSCAELGKVDGQLVIGLVGWLNENKNVSLLLGAVAQLIPYSLQLRVMVVGDGPLRSRLQVETRQKGLQDVVTFLGQRPFAEKLMPAFDVLCLTSNSEGMPNVLMEASAAGVPVVATDVGGVREVVVDGETGFLVSKGDVNELTDRMHRLLIDPVLRQEMGAAGRRRMQREFSVERMVQRYQDLYLGLLRCGRGS